MPEDGDGDVEEDPFGDVEIPDYIPLPEDHELVQAIGNPDAGYTIILNSAMPLSEASAFYESELPDAGWESVEVRESGGADVVTIEAERSDDDHTFVVQISGQDSGTSMQIFTGPPG